ncbi:MAG: 3-phosphoshikimate 1-carboxyvinyltransferase [Alphaproteobacteria bacterium]|nr:MAG: 3-phosphoshikimate 1-carboxyvinyltransferase [Alphaproteobacteria bacterium]
MVSIISIKSNKLSGEVFVPGDKSISHRALILGACAVGKTTIENLLESEDVLATLSALSELGVNIKKSKNLWEVRGNGLGSLRSPDKVLNLGNSGTGVRLLMGLVSGCDIEVTFTGDESLNTRPMKRVLIPLEQSGAEILSNDNKLPITIKGNKIPIPIKYNSSLSSAQVKSCVLLNGLTSTGNISYSEKVKSRDHTEKMLNFMGAEINSKSLNDGTNKIELKGLPYLKGKHFIIPNDPSSAAFPSAVALIIPDSEIKIKNVCLNSLRTGFYETIIEMGGAIKFINKKNISGEEVGDIQVKYSKLKGVVVPEKRVPSMIDEFPIFCIVSCFAEGETVMTGIKDLRNKESDRIKEMVQNLNRCGFSVKSTSNSISIIGNKKVNPGKEIVIDSKFDHRIAMSFLCLGLLMENGVKVKNAETINSSFPSFYDIMKSLGANLKK